MNNKYERVWKNVIVAQFNVLFRHLPAELRETTQILSQDSRSPGRDMNPGFAEYEVAERITT
jgi:hypothetical protein